MDLARNTEILSYLSTLSTVKVEFTFKLCTEILLPIDMYALDVLSDDATETFLDIFPLHVQMTSNPI